MFVNKSILVIYFLLIRFTLNMKINNFCILKSNIQEQAICKNEQCEFYLCSDHKKSCENLNNWYASLEKYVENLKVKKIIKLIYYFNKFLDNIKECGTTQYISLKKQVCSIKENCQFNQHYELSQLFKPFKLKPKSCFCSGKLSLKCGEYYCADNKHTCNKILKYISESAKSEKKINKC
jgi:hypothetical protein